MKKITDKMKNGKGKYRKWLAAAVVVLILLAVFLLPRLIGGKSETEELTFGETTLLTLGDMENSISAAGTVESADSVLVYSTLAYPVEEVLVEVGDTVQEGELLARLDGQTVRDQITSQQIGLSNARAGGEQQVKAAQENYDNYKEGLDEGLNAAIISAQTQVDNAYDNYVKAQDAYERYQSGIKGGKNTSLVSAASSRDSAEAALDSARTNYNAAKKIYDSAKSALASAKAASEQEPGNTELAAAYAAAQAAYDSAETKYASARTAYYSAETAYDNADSLYQATDNSVQDALEDYEAAVETAKRNYDAACTNLEATKKSTKEQLQGLENNLNTAKIGANTALTEETIRQLQVNLADTEIKAPCGGTVTAVYAKVGASGAGILFVIEDVEHLVVETTIKEYDLGVIRVGMKVLITSDATGDREIGGTVSKIAPTANKTAQGITDTTGDAVFAVEIDVDEAGSGLFIGTEAQLDYIVDAVSDVLTVPYDAVYENETGADTVLVAEEQSDGRFLISERKVSIGVANDLDVVIEGDGIREGLRVVNVPEKYLSLIGKTVSIGEDRPEIDPMAEMMGMGGM